MNPRFLMLTALLSSTAALAAPAQPNYEAAVQFLEPLVGFHHLEIDKDAFGTKYGVLVRTAGRTLGAALAGP